MGGRFSLTRCFSRNLRPMSPTRPEYRQGTTLGDGYKHWFRAKFFQQYRLFFRYHASSKVIVLAWWVNDEDTKRAYGRNNDAYRVCWPPVAPWTTKSPD